MFARRLPQKFDSVSLNRSTRIDGFWAVFIFLFISCVSGEKSFARQSSVAPPSATEVRRTLQAMFSDEKCSRSALDSSINRAFRVDVPTNGSLSGLAGAEPCHGTSAWKKVSTVGCISVPLLALDPSQACTYSFKARLDWNTLGRKRYQWSETNTSSCWSLLYRAKQIVMGIGSETPSESEGGLLGLQTSACETGKSILSECTNPATFQACVAGKYQVIASNLRRQRDLAATLSKEIDRFYKEDLYETRLQLLGLKQKFSSNVAVPAGSLARFAASTITDSDAKFLLGLPTPTPSSYPAEAKGILLAENLSATHSAIQLKLAAQKLTDSSQTLSNSLEAKADLGRLNADGLGSLGLDKTPPAGAGPNQGRDSDLALERGTASQVPSATSPTGSAPSASNSATAGGASSGAGTPATGASSLPKPLPRLVASAGSELGVHSTSANELAGQEGSKANAGLDSPNPHSIANGHTTNTGPDPAIAKGTAAKGSGSLRSSALSAKDSQTLQGNATSLAAAGTADSYGFAAGLGLLESIRSAFGASGASQSGVGGCADSGCDASTNPGGAGTRAPTAGTTNSGEGSNSASSQKTAENNPDGKKDPKEKVKQADTGAAEKAEVASDQKKQGGPSELAALFESVVVHGSKGGAQEHNVIFGEQASRAEVASSIDPNQLIPTAPIFVKIKLPVDPKQTVHTANNEPPASGEPTSFDNFDGDLGLEVSLFQRIREKYAQLYANQHRISQNK